MNKTTAVLNHLKTYGTITSWEAINQYGATRLSSIIFNLKKRGYDISTIMIHDVDRYDNDCKYALYKLN